MSTMVAVTSKTKTKNYFYKEIKFLRLFGLSLTGNDSVAYNIFSFFWVGAMNFVYPCLAVGDVFKHDFSVVSGMMVYQFSTFAGLAKTAVMLRNRIKIGRVLNKLEQEPFIPDQERGGDEEAKLINRCLKITHIQAVLYWIVTVLCIIGATTFTIIKRMKSSDSHDWQFTYGPFTVINTTYSPNFELMATYQTLSILCISVHFTTIDLITAAVLAHMSFQFKILQNSLRRMVQKNIENMQKGPSYASVLAIKKLNSDHNELDNSDIPWKDLKKSVKKVVHHHLAIIDIAGELEDAFSNLLLLVYLGTLGMVCFLVYRASVSTNDTAVFIRALAEMSSVFFQILTVCYWGEQVIQESQLVGRAAYEANYLGTDLRFQKALVLIIRRSQNPTRLTAGKFTDVCLTTFTWILRSSYSMFMVLQSNNQKK